MNAKAKARFFGLLTTGLFRIDQKDKPEQSVRGGLYGGGFALLAVAIITESVRTRSARRLRW